MKQMQSAVPTNPSAASLGRDRREKSEISDIRRFCFAFWGLPSVEVQSLLLLSKSLMPHLNASGKEEMEPFLTSYGTTRCPMAPAMLFAEYEWTL